MAFEWGEYLALAKALKDSTFEGVSQEAIDRCIVSRAYYAAFKRSFNYARKNKDFEWRGAGEDHSAVQRWLKKHKQADIAMLLSNLKLWREHCDYKDELGDLPSLVEQSLKQAETVLERIRPD